MFIVPRSHSNPVRSIITIRLTRVRSQPTFQTIKTDQDQRHSNQDQQNEEIQVIISSNLQQLKDKVKEQQQIIEVYKSKIKELEEKFEEQERAHNREIVQLKCNLDNSIFEEYEDNQLHIIQEEDPINPSVAQSTEMKYDASPFQQEVINLFSQIEIDDGIIYEGEFESYLLTKLRSIVEYCSKLDLQIDDWKRTYWNLEKKFNQLEQIKSISSYKQGSQEIELEFDFEKKKIVNIPKTQESDEVRKLKEQIKKLAQSNDELKKQIMKNHPNKNQLQSLIQKQKLKGPPDHYTIVKEPGNKSVCKVSSSHQQLTKERDNERISRDLKKDYQQQKPQFYQEKNQVINPNTTRNHYFSHYFQQQQQRVQSNRHSPMSINTSNVYTRLNVTQFSKEQSMEKYVAYSPSVYSTPIIIKQSSLSPYAKSSKYLQF
ncbi:hypothetical protein pb186bvf_013773 [Paramecium bursaria]